MNSSSAKISGIITTPIAITDPPLLNCAGVHAPYALRIILEIETDIGIIGISEIPGNIETEEAIKKVSPKLIGTDVFNMHLISKLTNEVFYHDEDEDLRGGAPWDQRIGIHVFSAIEVACWDVIGKILDRPVCDLLGGKMRDLVPFSAYLFYKYEGAGGDLGYNTDPNAEGWAAARQREATSMEGIVDQAIDMCAAFGFNSIKLKGGAFSPEKEVEDCLAIRREFGRSMPLRFDPNAVWSLATGIKWAKVLKDDLEYLEDPVRGQTHMAALRKEVDISLATNMCTTSLSDIPSSIEMHSEDIILSDHHFWGGLKATMQLYSICKTIGRGFSMHSNSHLGISMAVMVHIGAALPVFDHEFDTHYPWQSEDVIVGGKLKIEGGCVEVPRGPGLGVEIDRKQLIKLHEDFLKCGLTKRDDEAEMKKINPEWEFMETRY